MTARRKLFAWVTIRSLLIVSALLTLLGLALMVWSLLEPTPLPVILAMSIGQGFGILAFALFGGVVLADQLRKQREKGAAAAAAAVPGDSLAGAAGAVASPAPLAAASSTPSLATSPTPLAAASPTPARGAPP